MRSRVVALCAVLGFVGAIELSLRARYRRKMLHRGGELPGTRRIAAFGDSIVAGSPGPLQEAWPARLQERLNNAYPDAGWSVRNVGVSGDTVSKGFARFERDVAPCGPDVTLIAFGLNDCYPARQGLDRWLEGEIRGRLRRSYLLRSLVAKATGMLRGLRLVGQPCEESISAQLRTSPGGFASGLAALIERSRAIGSETVLLTMTPLGGDHLEGVFRRLPHYDRYNEIIRMVAWQERVKWVDLSGIAPERALEADGFHLTGIGHRRVADHIFTSLDSEHLWADKGSEGMQDGILRRSKEMAAGMA